MKGLLLTLFIQLVILQVFAQDYKKVQAKDGDGIYSLLRRYNLNPAEYLNDFIELNKKSLGKNNELLKGTSYLLPVPENVSTEGSAAETGVFPIFGKDYKNIGIQHPGAHMLAGLPESQRKMLQRAQMARHIAGCHHHVHNLDLIQRIGE